MSRGPALVIECLRLAFFPERFHFSPKGAGGDSALSTPPPNDTVGWGRSLLSPSHLGLIVELVSTQRRGRFPSEGVVFRGTPPLYFLPPFFFSRDI